jgi:16S rRNA processing protein RimM
VTEKIVLLGHISGVHGVKGWVKIHSLTDPREAIFQYQPWLLGESHEEIRFSEGKKHGSRLIALLEDINDREAAEGLVNRSIAVHRDQFPETEAGEFYWTDLVGLRVELEDGTVLGTLENLLATGAHDVMVVKGEKQRLIPFVQGQYVKQVDLESGLIVVDWDLDY